MINKSLMDRVLSIRLENPGLQPKLAPGIEKTINVNNISISEWFAYIQNPKPINDMVRMVGKSKVTSVLPHLKEIADVYKLNLSLMKDFKIAKSIFETRYTKI